MKRSCFSSVLRSARPPNTSPARVLLADVDEPLDELLDSQEKRYRDFGTQVDTQCRDCHAQTDATWSELALEKLKQEKKKKKKPAVSSRESVRAANSRAANFAPIDKLKEKATAAAMKKQYNVQDYYKVPQTWEMM